MEFDVLFSTRKVANHISKSEGRAPYYCFFGGFAETEYRHFVTFSGKCFSDNPCQKNLSIFVDPDSDLPKWKGVATGDDFLSENAVVHYIDFTQNPSESDGTKIGGEPCFIRGAQADLFLSGLQENDAQFVLQLDEEDCFFISQPDIDKALRDVLCGGVLYLFAPISKDERVIDFNSCYFDHQM